MKKQKPKKSKKERIKKKIKIIEKDMDGGTMKIYHLGEWKDEEVMHGKYQEYFQPLEAFYSPKIICNYRYGILNGKYESWYEDGYKANEGRYKNGKKIGRWVKWFSNGGLESIVHYKNGKMDGKSIEYYRDGGKMTEEVYKNDKFIKQTGEWEYEDMKDYEQPDIGEFL